MTQSTMNYSSANSQALQNSTLCFDGTQLVQMALSALMRTNQQVSNYTLICILRGYTNEEVTRYGYNLLRTFGIGRSISYDDWQDYLHQMRLLGLIEVDYRYSRNLRITNEGLDVLYGRRNVTLKVISRQEDMALYDKLCRLREQQATQENVPATWLFTDDSLHAMALRKPKTQNAFRYIAGVDDSKKEKYGQAYVTLIRDHINPRNTLTINGKKFEIPIELWDCMNWREALKRVQTLHYWNFYEAKQIPLSEVITSTIMPQEKAAEVMTLFGNIIRETFMAECSEENITIPQRIEVDENGAPVVSLKCSGFADGLRKFQAFVNENQHYPLCEGTAYECSLRRWYQEVGHGYIKTTEEEHKAFEQLSDIYADVPKNRAQWEKKLSEGNISTGNTLK